MTESPANRVAKYVNQWRKCGYQDGIPDESPAELERLMLAPSYRQMALALLRNDLSLHSLGFAAPVSAWYRELKRIEIEQRPQSAAKQLRIW